MATQSTKIDIDDGWVKVHDGGTDAIIQCASVGGTVLLVFANSSPSNDDNYHILRGGETINTIGSDDVYVKSEGDGTIVTVSS